MKLILLLLLGIPLTGLYAGALSWQSAMDIFTSQSQTRATHAVLTQNSGAKQPVLSKYLESLLFMVITESRGIDAEQEIWPGFHISGYPMLLHRTDEVAILIGHPQPPDDFKPYYIKGINKAAPVYIKEGGLPSAPCLDFDYDINGTKTLVYRIRDNLTQRDAFGNVIHERFHVYQHSMESLSAMLANSAAYSYKYPLYDHKNLALAQLEQYTLAETLDSLDSNDLKEKLKDFMAVRLTRYKRYGQPAVMIETSEEWREGMAEYVDYKAQDHAYKNKASIAEIQKRLNTGLQLDQMLAWRYYATGAALGYILDKVYDDQWKARVQKGETPWQILSEIEPLNIAQRSRRLLKTKIKFDFINILWKSQRKVKNSKNR
ncbi:hypothetical protein ACFL6Y_09715 [Elusimicrobiota bacterium]